MYSTQDVATNTSVRAGRELARAVRPLAPIDQDRSGGDTTTLAAVLLGGLLVASLALVVATAVAGPTATVSVGGDGRFALAWRVDRLAALLCCLVSLVALVVASYGTRYLAGEQGRGRFALIVPLMALSTIWMVTAATPVTFALGWTAAEVGLVALLGLEPTSNGVAAARRAACTAFVITDVALWTAVVLIGVRFGRVDLGTATMLDAPRWFCALLGALLALAAAGRCALWPLSLGSRSRWRRPPRSPRCCTPASSMRGGSC